MVHQNKLLFNQTSDIIQTPEKQRKYHDRALNQILI